MCVHTHTRSHFQSCFCCWMEERRLEKGGVGALVTATPTLIVFVVRCCSSSSTRTTHTHTTHTRRGGCLLALTLSTILCVLEHVSPATTTTLNFFLKRLLLLGCRRRRRRPPLLLLYSYYPRMSRRRRRALTSLSGLLDADSARLYTPPLRERERDIVVVHCWGRGKTWHPSVPLLSFVSWAETYIFTVGGLGEREQIKEREREEQQAARPRWGNKSSSSLALLLLSLPLRRIGGELIADIFQLSGQG